MNYGVIIIVHEGSIFLISWVYVPMNVSQSNELNELPSIAMQQTGYPQYYVPTNQQTFDNPRTLVPTNENDSTVVCEKYTVLVNN